MSKHNTDILLEAVGTGRVDTANGRGHLVGVFHAVSVGHGGPMHCPSTILPPAAGIVKWGGQKKMLDDRYKRSAFHDSKSFSVNADALSLELQGFAESKVENGRGYDS